MKINYENPIRIFPDGDMWCALFGEDLQVGIAGFGKTPVEALKAWETENEKPTG